MAKILLGGVEAGGTKFNCVVAQSPTQILASTSFATTEPAETLANAVSFFNSIASEHGEIQALGIGSFGPIDLNKSSATYGHITTTPKMGWQNTNIVEYFEQALSVPVAFNTDVNSAAIAEHKWGAGAGLSNLVYCTVGTGIGAGVIAENKLVNSTNSPELGHIPIPKHRTDEFQGSCPYHSDCLEGLASGPAIEKRWGTKAINLPPDHPAWSLQADYLAKLCITASCAYAPQKIILGGGVMSQKHLYAKIHTLFLSHMQGYLSHINDSNIADYIVPPRLDKPGEMGALYLASTLGTV